MAGPINHRVLSDRRVQLESKNRAQFGNNTARYFSSRCTVARRAVDSPFMGNEADGGGEHAQAILHAAAEIDGGGFLEVLGGAGDFADVEAKHDGLGDHLVVEDKVVGVLRAGEAVSSSSREKAR